MKNHHPMLPSSQFWWPAAAILQKQSTKRTPEKTIEQPNSTSTNPHTSSDTATHMYAYIAYCVVRLLAYVTLPRPQVVDAATPTTPSCRCLSAAFIAAFLLLFCC